MSYRSQTQIANDRDYTTSFTNEYDRNKSALTIVTPTSGTSLKIASVYISTEGCGTAGQKIKLYFATSGNTVATFFPTTTPATFRTEMLVRGNRNEVLSMTSDIGDDKNFFVTVNYSEE